MTVPSNPYRNYKRSYQIAEGGDIEMFWFHINLLSYHFG